MKVYYDKDADLSLIKRMKVTIVGYGSQGHAHALNLSESGVKVTVGLRKGGASWDKAKAAGLKVEEIDKAVKGADLVMMLLPDENIPQVYRDSVAPNIKNGGVLAFAHGFNVHYNQVVARDDLDVIMIAPKGPGHTVRSEYVKGGGVPTLIAIHQDKSGKAHDIALSYAAANGGTKGYAPEMAYFECLHEMKLIVDLMYEGGIANMNYSISNNAEYGEYVTGPKVINDASRAAMREALKRIQTGEYAKQFIAEGNSNYPSMTAYRRLNAAHQIEVVGEQLRGMMPWISKNKLVDQSKN